MDVPLPRCPVSEHAAGDTTACACVRGGGRGHPRCQGRRELCLFMTSFWLFGVRHVRRPLFLFSAARCPPITNPRVPLAVLRTRSLSPPPWGRHQYYDVRPGGRCTAARLCPRLHARHVASEAQMARVAAALALLLLAPVALAGRPPRPAWADNVTRVHGERAQLPPLRLQPGCWRRTHFFPAAGACR